MKGETKYRKTIRYWASLDKCNASLFSVDINYLRPVDRSSKSANVCYDIYFTAHPGEEQEQQHEQYIWVTNLLTNC